MYVFVLATYSLFVIRQDNWRNTEALIVSIVAEIEKLLDIAISSYRGPSDADITKILTLNEFKLKSMVLQR